MGIPGVSPFFPCFVAVFSTPGAPGAGDVLFFSEATVHGAMAWTAEHERRGAWPGNPWGLGCDYPIIYHDIYIYIMIYIMMDLLWE